MNIWQKPQTYDMCLENLGNGKTLGPNNIPNIIKKMPTRFHKLMLLFFTHYYKQKIQASWKTSHTIFLFKKHNPHHLINYRPIALTNTKYKLFTSTITSILAIYGEQHQILHDNQKGFES